jgi:pectate lyase
VNVTALSGGSSGRPWEAILSEASGFARNVTGGAGGQLISVTNLNDSGSGSLRAALGVSGRTWIRFSQGLTGTVNLQSPLKPNPNTTIDGRGARITLDWRGSGYGIYMTNTSNIIIMYLTLQNAGYDIVHFRNGFTGGWLHHLTFDRTIDELISMRNGADNVTISWCRMNDNTRGALLRSSGDSDAQWDDVYSHATLHHNFWTRSLAWRVPKMANVGHFHIYNDYNQGDAMIHAINRAQVLVENTIFEPDTSGFRKLATTQDGQLDGLSKAVGNLLLKNATLNTKNSSGVFSPPYSYSMDAATTATRDRIIAGAGWQNLPFPE